MSKTIGILTAGGDSPGLNAAIRGVGKTAIGAYDMRVVGFRDGFRGLMEKRGVAELVPAIRGLRVDPDGRIWASRGGPRPEPTPTDVLAADGTYLGTLPAEAPFPIGFLPDGRVLAVETDALEVERLVVYRIADGTRG